MTQFSFYSDWYVNYKENEMLTLWNFPPHCSHQIQIMKSKYTLKYSL